MTITESWPSNPHEATSSRRKRERAVFKVMNERLMLPMLQSRFRRYIGSPATGYFVLLRTTGRRSGLPRTTPLNYAIDDGCVCCLAGFGQGTHWLSNLQANPCVQATLPDRTIEGIAEEVQDRAEARRLAVRVARNSGLALAIENPQCLFMSDAELAAVLDGRPAVRIHPLDMPVVPGRYDPGGRGWILPTLLFIAAHVLFAAGLAKMIDRINWQPRPGAV